MRNDIDTSSRRRFLSALVGAAMPIASFAQRADSWPTRAVRLIVPFPAGGNSDTTARLLGEALAVIWKQPVVVENRPGAGGTIGTMYVARQPADGYTLGLAGFSTHATAPSMYTRLQYEPLRDFAFIAPLTFTPNVLLVHPKLPINNVRDLAAYAKSHAGKLNYSSPGLGLSDHLVMELLLKEIGATALHVPYKGSPEARTAVIAGDVQMTFGTASAALAQIAAGQLRAIAVSGDRRLSVLPNVPTVLEQGVPSAVAYTWTGLCAPKGLPEHILQKIHQDTEAVLTQPDIHERIAASASEVKQMSPAEFREYVAAETKRWGEVIRRSGIKAE